MRLRPIKGDQLLYLRRKDELYQLGVHVSCPRVDDDYASSDRLLTALASVHTPAAASPELTISWGDFCVPRGWQGLVFVISRGLLLIWEHALLRPLGFLGHRGDDSSELFRS